MKKYNKIGAAVIAAVALGFFGCPGSSGPNDAPPLVEKTITLSYAEIEDNDFDVEDIILYKVSDTPKTATITLIDSENAYSGIIWSIEDTPTETANPLTLGLDASDYLLGRHRIGVELWKGNKPYSKTIYLNVRY